MNLSYEMCKKLKDAGFPQKEPLLYPPYQGELDTSTLAPVYVPTLSELIEACGKDFAVLIRCENGWHVGADGHPFSTMAEERPQGCGSNLSEAFANLYLALNSSTPDKEGA